MWFCFRYVPYDWYPDEKYPDYLCGPTYLMSSDVAKKLFLCAMQTPVFYIEDVYVTGICAKKVNITPKHNSLFTCQHQTSDICQHRHLFSIHYYTPEAMRSSHQLLEKNSCSKHVIWVGISGTVCEYFNTEFCVCFSAGSLLFFKTQQSALIASILKMSLVTLFFIIIIIILLKLSDIENYFLHWLFLIVI